jgi:PAS domain S-box-containing protein
MKYSLGQRIGSGFAAALLMLSVIGIVSYNSTTRLLANTDWVVHTHQVLENLQSLQTSVSDAQTGARSYYLTGEGPYLESYRPTVERVRAKVRTIRALTADNPSQQRRLDVLEPLLNRKLAIAKETIELRREHSFAAFVGLVQAGKLVMDQIREVVGEMENEERGLLTQRVAETNASGRTARKVIILASLLSLLLVSLSSLFIHREMQNRHRADEMQRTQAEEIADLYNRAPCGYHSINGEGMFLRMNETELSWLGYTREEVLGKMRFFDLLTPESVAVCGEHIRRLKEQGSIQGCEVEMVKKNGDIFSVAVSATAIKDAAGNLVMTRASVFDITERKEAEQVLDRFFTLSLDPLCIAGFDGYFKRLNPAWERIFGFTVEELTARPFLDFVHPDDREPTVSQSDNLAAGDTCTSFENRYLCKDGSYKWLLWNATPLPERQEIYAVGHDISERRQTEEALREAKEQAEAASRFKDQFLSMMSHELRTPLNAILGFSVLLPQERYGTLNDRQRRYVDHIHKGGTHLHRLINDILDLSKIEAGRLEMAMGPVDVAGALDEVVNSLLPLAEQKSQTLSLKADPKITVQADPTRLQQVLINLAGNAIKFTPAGGRIELEAHRDSTQVRFSVRDNGPGIPPEEKTHIFEAFHRLRQAGEAVEGSGLGLAIARQLVELQGGHLELDSQDGQGSCFYFSLPLAAWIPEATPTKAKFSDDGIPRVLVIEDDLAAGRLISSHLSSAGYEPVECYQPAEALETAARVRPHAITLDVKMKPLNGWEVLAQLKADERTSRIPVILVTIVDEKAVGTILGADGYLLKPVKKADLSAALERCLNGRGGKVSARPVLVVEDDADTREFVAESIRAHGYSVVTASDGAEARAIVDAAVPELVILDLRLPSVSGWELLAEWRGNPRTADLPVFVITGKDLTAEEEKAVKASAEGLFLKQQGWQQSLTQQLDRVLNPPGKEAA